MRLRSPACSMSSSSLAARSSGPTLLAAQRNGRKTPDQNTTMASARPNVDAGPSARPPRPRFGRDRGFTGGEPLGGGPGAANVLDQQGISAILADAHLAKDVCRVQRRYGRARKFAREIGAALLRDPEVLLDQVLRTREADA